jgi:hypothetical protein
VNSLSRAPNLAQSRNNYDPPESSNANPWVLLRISDCCLLAMLDLGSSLSFVRRDVFNEIKDLRLPHTVEKTLERCQMANAGVCDVTQAVVLPIKLHDLSWMV